MQFIRFINSKVFLDVGDHDAIQWALNYGISVADLQELAQSREMLQVMEVIQIPNIDPNDGSTMKDLFTLDKDTSKDVCLILVTSGKEKTREMRSHDLFKVFLRSFIETLSVADMKTFTFQIFVGIKERDPFFDDPNNIDELQRLFSKIESKLSVLFHIIFALDSESESNNFHILSGLANMGYWKGCEYFYQVDDTLMMIHKKWTHRLIQTLESNSLLSNLGVVFPSHMKDPTLRAHPFFHRTHLDLFGTLFPPSLKGMMKNEWMNLMYWSLNSNFSASHVLVDSLVPSFDSKDDSSSFFDLNTELKRSCSSIADHLSNSHPDIFALLSERSEDVIERNSFEESRMKVLENYLKPWKSPQSDVWKSIDLLSSNNQQKDRFYCPQVLMNHIEWKDKPIVESYHERFGLIDDKRIERERDLALEFHRYWESGAERRKTLIEFVGRIKEKSEWLKKMKNEGNTFNNTLIVTFTNWGQMEMTENWIQQMRKWGYDNFIVFCYDRKSFEYLQEREINSFFHQSIESDEKSQNYAEGEYAMMINIRLLPFFDLLRNGNDILMIDNDVVILKEMFSHMNDSDKDIIAQNGASHPNQFGVCCGFIFFRSIPIVIRLFSDMIIVAQFHQEHDQGAINMLQKMLYKNVTNTLYLPFDAFPNGYAFFKRGQPLLKKDDPVIIHNNYIVSLESKIHRYREVLLWDMDSDSRLFLDSFHSTFSPHFLKLSQAEISSPGSFLKTFFDSHSLEKQKESESNDVGWKEEFEIKGDEEHNSGDHLKKDDALQSLSKRDQLISNMIIQLSQTSPRSNGRLVYFPQSSFKSLDRMQHREEMIKAFMIAESLNRTLVVPRISCFEVLNENPDCKWTTIDYFYNISMMQNSGLSFRENSFLFHPRVVKNFFNSPLSQSVLIDLLSSGKKPFEAPLSNIFDNPLVKAEFLVPEPIQFKRDAFHVDDIQKMFGSHSPFSDVPVLLFSTLLRDIVVNQEGSDFKMMEGKVLEQFSLPVSKRSIK